MGFASDIGITFGLSAEASQAVAAVGLLTTAVGALEAVTVDTGFKFADFAKRVRDIEVETGLAARTVSTLSAATDFLTNTSMANVNKAVDLYLQRSSEAAHHNQTFAASFRRFSVDATLALQNPDKSVVALIDHLAKIPSSAERLDEAWKLAGRGGKALADVAEQVRKMGGSFEAFQKQAESWGVVLSEEDVEAAERFKESMTIMGEKVEGIVYHIGRAALPELGKALDDINFVLGTNQGGWERWELAIATILARVRGSIEGFTKWLKTTTNYSPWDMGKDIQEGADEAGNQAVIDWEMGRQRDKDRRPPPPYRPMIGDVAQRGAADKARNEAARRIEEENRQIEESYKRHVEELQRDFGLEITSSQTYTKKLIDEAGKRYEEVKANLDKEAALYKPGTSGAEKVKAGQQKAQDERDKAVQKAKDDQNKREIDALQAHREALLKLADTYDEESIAAIESNAELGALTYEAAENKKFDLQTKAYDRRLQALRDDEANFYAAQKDINDVNKEEAQKYSDAIDQIQEGQEKAQQQHERDTDGARRKDLQREREYRQAMKQLRQQAVADDIAIQRMELEAAGAQGSAPGANPTIAERVNIIRQLADLDRKAEEERHKQTLDSIRQQEDAAKRQAELDHQTFEDEKTFNTLRENEARRHSQAMGQIQRQQQEGEDEANPLKGAIDNLKKTTTVTDFLSNQAAAGLNKMTSAFGSAIEANLLYGQSIGKAMKAALAEYLAHVASESAIEALRQAAWGVAMLAEGNFASAAEHFEAAALFGALALGSGLAASSLAKSAGLRGDSSATSGSSAGQAITSTATPAAPTTISLGRPGGAPDPNVVHLIVETHTTNDPGTLTEHIITTIDKNGRAQKAVVSAARRDYVMGGVMKRIVLHGAGDMTQNV